MSEVTRLAAKHFVFDLLSRWGLQLFFTTSHSNPGFVIGGHPAYGGNDALSRGNLRYSVSSPDALVAVASVARSLWAFRDPDLPLVAVWPYVPFQEYEAAYKEERLKKHKGSFEYDRENHYHCAQRYLVEYLKACAAAARLSGAWAPADDARAIERLYKEAEECIVENAERPWLGCVYAASSGFA